MSDDSHTSPWVAAIATGTLALLISAGGVWVAQGNIATRAEEQETKTREAIDALTDRVGKLEALPAADPSSKADINAATAPLQERLTTLEAQPAAANARLETIENMPSAAPTTRPVEATATVTSAAPEAAVLLTQTPAISEAEHMVQFKTILSRLPTPNTAAEGTANTINERFGGLITIKKTLPDLYAPLRDAQTVAEARAAIAILPLEQQAPFMGWIASLENAAEGTR